MHPVGRRGKTSRTGASPLRGAGADLPSEKEDGASKIAPEERSDEPHTPSFRDGALAPDLRCAIAHRGISKFRVRCFASPRNDGLRQYFASNQNKGVTIH